MLTNQLVRQFFESTTPFAPKRGHVQKVNDDSIEFMLAVPGLKKEDMKITTHTLGNLNNVSVELPPGPLSEKDTVTVTFDQSYNVKKAKASVRDGVLIIHIPLLEEARGTIAIE